MKNHILVAGSINMDLVIEVARLPTVGETIIGKSIRYVPGGKGANQAIAASRLGAKVSFMGKVGRDSFGKQLFNFLQSENIMLSGVTRSNTSSGLAQITVDAKGNNTIVVLPGSNSEVKPEYIIKHVKLIKEASLVITQYEIPLSSVDALFTIAKKYNKTTLLNPAPAAKTPKSLLQKTDYLVLNETELSILMESGKIIEDTNQITAYARKLLGKGPKIVIVTLGSRGAVAVTQNKILVAEGIKVKAIDTTAAGDCFIGALASQIKEKVDLKNALNFANKASAISVQRWGASSSLPTLEEVRRFL